jgi:uncharacterized protein
VTLSVDRSNVPDYGQLVQFLFQPFLSVADAATTSHGSALSVDCEYTIDRRRVWIRVAITSSDQGSAFGRGGRNIQAIRTVLQAAATAVGQSIHLDVYGSSSSSKTENGDRSDRQSAHPGRGATAGDRPSAGRPTRSAPHRRPASGGDPPSGSDSPGTPPPRPRR